MDMNTTLGAVIKKQREALGINQRDLAKAVNINNSTISRIENNPQIVADPKTLKAIANKLKLDYNYLLSLNQTIDDQKEIRIIARASKKMEPVDREKMLSVLRREFEDAFKDTDSDGVIEEGDSEDF